MPGPRNAKPVRIAAFPVGVNNIAKEHAQPRDDYGRQLSAREAVNVVFDAEGKASRRDGYTLARAGTRTHSLWSDDYLGFGLMVDADTLYAVENDLSVTLLKTDMAANLPVSYCRINDTVFWTNGVQSGQVSLTMQTRDWAVHGPSAQPTVAAGTGGALYRGTYQIAVTFFDSFGRESGTERPVMVDVAENGLIELTNIPQPPAGGRVRIYCSGGQGGELRAAYTLDEGITSFTLAQMPEGRSLDTLLLKPMPPGQYVAYGNGRLFVARNREILFSPALRYGLFNPKSDRVRLTGRVTMMAFVGDGTDGAGLFAADNKRTYFFAGASPKDWSPVIAFPYGAVPGSITFATGDVWGLQTKQLLPIWMSTNGRLCVGTPGGTVFLPQPREDGQDVVFDNAERAALVYRENHGDKRVVAALKGSTKPRLAMSDSLVARVYPHSPDP